MTVELSELTPDEEVEAHVAAGASPEAAALITAISRGEVTRCAVVDDEE